MRRLVDKSDPEAIRFKVVRNTWVRRVRAAYAGDIIAIAKDSVEVIAARVETFEAALGVPVPAWIRVGFVRGDK
jgi:hypothetical protein